MSRFNIGIDTGGTYTDAVIVDLHGRAVIASAKAVTTHGDLSIGVSNAIRSVLADAGSGFDRSEIALVSVSTTLATNALVEGQGASVAAILIGFDERMAVRTRISEAVADAEVIRIDGGHDHAGQETSALDLESLRAAVLAVRGKADAFAVASMYSVRNASHEHRAQQIINDMTGRPVTISSELSDALDGPRRALTATLNARIISKVVAMVAAVRRSLTAENIDSRLMIVKGDGSLASAELVVEHPIETILSGPAASVIGARYLSREKHFIISDIGGTTTDIATAHGGWPDISHSGSVVGEYRTMVRAIDMHTSGLGGDSEVLTDYSGAIRLGSNRVVPISLLGSRWPSVAVHLGSVLNAGRGLRTACRFLLRPEGFDPGAMPADLSDRDRRFLDQIGDAPTPWSAVVHHKSEEQRAHRLMSRGLIAFAGFTPSDAAHVLGRQSQWCADTARLACEIQGHNGGLVSRRKESIDDEITAFAEAVIDIVIQKSTHLLLEQLARRRFGGDDPLVAAVTSGAGNVADLDVALSPSIPVVAVGGPARLYYPEVGRRLGTNAIIPPHADVANAVGAAVGMIKTHCTIEITANEAGGFWVHINDDPAPVASAGEALNLAEAVAREHALSQAGSMGAVDVDVAVDVQRVDLPDTEHDVGLVAATITVECTGRLD